MQDLFSCTCPCCGGSLKFEASLQKVKCEYCDTEFEVSDLKELNDSANTIEENTSWDTSSNDEYNEDDALNLYLCETCGGEVMCDENTTSTLCPYCGNPVILKGRLTGGLKPNYIIPFKLEKDTAKGNLIKYLKGKVLLPNDFKKLNEVKEVTSLYVPYWLFDASVNGMAKFRTTKVRTWSDSNYRYKETKHYQVIRGGEISFEKLPVDASKKMDDKMMESIEPFNFKEAKDYDNAYIVGYAADKYDVSQDETFERANVRIKEGTVDALRSTIHGYDTVNLTDATINYESNSAYYAYYPVWTLNSEYKEKKYQFAMNGQTGKLTGNLPISYLKATLISILSFLLFGGALFGLFFAIMSDSDNQILASVAAGLIGGIAITSLIMVFLVKQIKPVRFQHGAASYVVENSFNLSYKKDIYLYKNVTRTAIPKSNSNRR
jgi:DNA-directed RNA polymerase subunit RPC12/RpoP